MEIERHPLYAPGQLVRHRRYGYRGVVVDFDTTCLAEELWYHRNRTQPPRNQPWYHVLVDGSEATTYAAQTSLMPDDSGEPVTHPLVVVFFESFAAGRYERNENRIRGWTT
jgi:heat shock protein HspQ